MEIKKMSWKEYVKEIEGVFDVTPILGGEWKGEAIVDIDFHNMPIYTFVDDGVYRECYPGHECVDIEGMPEDPIKCRVKDGIIMEVME